MSIQSLNGAISGPPLPTQPRSTPVPVPDAVVKLPDLAVQQSAPKPEQPAKEQISQALERLKTAMPAKANALQFSIDDSSGDTIVRVLDGETGSVIRQIPSKELLEIAQAIDKMQGMLLKQKA